MSRSRTPAAAPPRRLDQRVGRSGVELDRRAAAPCCRPARGKLPRRRKWKASSCSIVARRHAARQVRAELDPLEGRRRILLELAGREAAGAVRARSGSASPRPRSSACRTRLRVLARCADAAHDARRIALVLHHEVHDVARADLAVAPRVVAAEFGDAEQPAPAVERRVGRLRQQRGLVVGRRACGRCSRPVPYSEPSSRGDPQSLNSMAQPRRPRTPQRARRALRVVATQRCAA